MYDNVIGIWATNEGLYLSEEMTARLNEAIVAVPREQDPSIAEQIAGLEQTNTELSATVDRLTTATREATTLVYRIRDIAHNWLDDVVTNDTDLTRENANELLSEMGATLLRGSWTVSVQRGYYGDVLATATVTADDEDSAIELAQGNYEVEEATITATFRFSDTDEVDWSISRSEVEIEYDGDIDEDLNWSAEEES